MELKYSPNNLLYRNKDINNEKDFNSTIDSDLSVFLPCEETTNQIDEIITIGICIIHQLKNLQK